jgi:hypothetical protein
VASSWQREKGFKELMQKIMSREEWEEFGQRDPIPNSRQAVWELVMEDMKKRNDFGVAKYGTPLQAFNGRDALKDAYEEALDLCVYLRTAIEERELNNKNV